MALGQGDSLSSQASQPVEPLKVKPNGEVVKGDLEYDGRVILYIIKGMVSELLTHQ